MHISEVTVNNFRSIKKLSLRLSPYTILVGENDAGKSNILRALDILFNVDRKIKQEDFSHHSIIKLIIVKVVLENIPSIHRSRLGLGKSQDRATVHFRFSNASGRSYKVNGNVISDEVVRSVFRRFYTYIAPIRDVAEHYDLATGKQFKAAINAMLDRVSEHRRNTVRRSAEHGLRKLNALLQRELNDLTTAIRRFAPTVDPQFLITADLPEFLRLMRLQLIDKTHPGSAEIDHKGQGLHSLVILALFAHAIQRRINGGILAIEEPELHLHPNLQRHYVVLMRNLSQSKRVQIVCTTHSPFLVNQVDMRRIARINRQKGQTIAIQPTPTYLTTDFKILEKSLTGLWGEMLLARAVLLVEGPSEYHSLPIWAAKISTKRHGKLMPCTFANHSVVVYPVGSVTNFANFIIFLKQFRTRVFVLADGDALGQGRILQQLRRAGVLSDLDFKRHANAVDRGQLARVRRWLSLRGVYIANEDYEDLVIDSKSESEVTRVVREHAPDEFEKFKVQITDPLQVVADCKNQTANRIRQFKDRLGVTVPLPGELNAITQMNAEFDRLFAEASAAGLPAAPVVAANLELLRKFVKKDKVIWHTRIVRGIKSGFESQALTEFIQNLISRNME